jgi:RNA polymerase sigma factor (sigma-70 family)
MSQRPLRVVPAQEADGSPAGTPDGLDFDDFFARESEGLFQRLWLVTRDRSEAEEVMQDAFLLYERWDRMAAVEDPKAYLYRTAFNAWNKRSRRASRALRTALAPSRGDDVDAAEARTVVGEALTRLSPRQRAAVVLTELLGFSSEDAGQMLGIRAVTARVLTSQARAAMRSYLGGPDD